MKFCRFVPKSAGLDSRVLPSYGLIEGEIIHGISGQPWLKWSREEASLPMREARLLAPVEPSKIVCVGRNYAAHAAELGNQVPKEPMIFLKTPSSVVATDEPIVLTRYSTHVDYEAELAVIIGRCKARIVCRPRVDFGRMVTRLTVGPGYVEVMDAPDPMVLVSPGVEWTVRREGQHDTAEGSVDLARAGGK